MTFYRTLPLFNDIVGTLERIERTVYEPVADLEITAWCSKEPLPYSRREQGVRRSLKKGEKWGDLFDCAWFRFTGTVPPRAEGMEIALLIDLSGEGLVVDGAGNPLQCLTTAASWYDFSLGRPGKRVVFMEGRSQAGQKIDIWVDAGNNDLFGMFQNNGTVQEASIAIRREGHFALYHDFSLLLDMLKELPEHSPRYQKILHALWKARNILGTFSDGEVCAARRELAPELARRNGDAPLRISAVGHAHLDLAWLWPIRETIRKGARTFSNVLALMERYPDFHFCASQPQLYQWMKDYYPALYARIKSRIAEGRWDPVGALWVEPDTNVTAGESLVRQVLYGKRFMKEEFGVDVRVLFLPDSFGYSGALPQIMKKAGVDYFVTTKLTWDRFNTYPHHTFFWEGIDGSRLLAHLPPEGTYNSSAAPRALRAAEREYLEKAVSDHCLLVFGIGDGGGGPGVEHLERLAREKDLEGLPPVTQEQLHRFLERLEAERERFHTWSGELFLACHQGTYTTQGRNKRNNRLMEIALRETEFLGVLASSIASAKYPSGALERIWKEVMLYQFHDILPGSSITRVYQETDARYAELERELKELSGGMVSAIGRAIRAGTARRPTVVFNTLSWPRREWICLSGRWQQVDVPSLGYALVDGMTEHAPAGTMTARTDMLENDLLRLSFSRDGSIASITDKEARREVLDGGPANTLLLFDDRGDAWDFTGDYEHRPAGRMSIVSSEPSLEGPYAEVRQTYSHGSSKMVQRVRLTAGSRRIDFLTLVDWQETGIMLRAVFPLNVRSSEAACEIQFGHVQRPTHRSSTWDKGKYEIPAQKWIDVSQRNYGVALLKENKYGHSVRGNVMDINLLRSPTYPDPTADRGRHEFTYALFPHSGDCLAGGVIRAAYELNYPLTGVPATPGEGELPPTFSFASVDRDNVIVEAVKKAEDDGSTTVRLYEAAGMDGEVRVVFGVPVRSARLSDLLEWSSEPLPVEDNSVRVRFRPFEILTLIVS